MHPDAPETQERINRLERALADLRASLPAHSVPPAMMLRIEELEEELDQLREAATPKEQERT